MDKIEEFTLQQVIDNQERVIKEQKEEIERLQAQLDREIHINRIMKRALKDISEQFDKIDFGDFEENFICKTSRIALKQIEEME